MSRPDSALACVRPRLAGILAQLLPLKRQVPLLAVSTSTSAGLTAVTDRAWLPKLRLVCQLAPFQRSARLLPTAHTLPGPDADAATTEVPAPSEGRVNRFELDPSSSQATGFELVASNAQALCPPVAATALKPSSAEFLTDFTTAQCAAAGAAAVDLAASAGPAVTAAPAPRTAAAAAAANARDFLMSSPSCSRRHCAALSDDVPRGCALQGEASPGRH